jgi:hypothetical protein
MMHSYHTVFRRTGLLLSIAPIGGHYLVDLLGAAAQACLER